MMLCSKKYFLILLVCLLANIKLEAVLFQEASEDQKELIDAYITTFYSSQLVEAGLFCDLETAIAATQLEENEHCIENPNTNWFYYNLVSDDQTQIYGYLVYTVEDQKAFLDAVYVEEPFKEQGIGQQALAKLEEELIAKHLSLIELYVFSHNSTAKQLYEKMGFDTKITYFHEGKAVGSLLQKELAV